MEETMSQTQDRWSYGLLRNGVCVASDDVRSSKEIGDEEGVLIRVQGLSVSLLVRGELVKLAPYLVYASPDIAGEIPVREYEGVIVGHRFGISCCDADVDIDLLQPDGTVWRGMCSYEAEGN
jgi:hypothetical protein